MSTTNLRRITYMVILIITFYLSMQAGAWIYTQIKNALRAHTDAPGATTAPGQSRIGKSVRSDPGGSIASSFFFEHNAFSQVGTELKLIPRSRQTTRMHMDGQIIFGIPAWGKYVFNIILIISLCYAIYYLVWLSTIYPHRVDNLMLSQVGNVSETGSESWIWTVHSACCAVCLHRMNKYVGYSCTRFLTTINL